MAQMIMMISREVRLVPLDFSWPLNKVWKGYKRSCGNDECDDENCQDCKPIEPPQGNCFQLWETVSEGSPVSPVFETKEELATWLSTTKREHDITNSLSYEDWLKVFEDKCPVVDMHTLKYLEK